MGVTSGSWRPVGEIISSMDFMNGGSGNESEFKSLKLFNAF